MNALRGRDAGVDHRGELGDRVVHAPADDEAEAVVDRAVDVGRGAPLAQAGQQRALGGRRRAGARVVEGEERRRAAERRRHRILEEPVRLGVGGDAGVGVDVDDARQDEQAGRVDDLGGGGGEPPQIRLDGRDPAAVDGDVRPARAGRGDDRAAAHHELTHHRLRDHDRIPANRPREFVGEPSAAPASVHLADRDRLGALPQAAPADLAQPVLPAVVGTIVAKWLAASWPTFDAVVQPPYGKKISHSLIPPG